MDAALVAESADPVLVRPNKDEADVICPQVTWQVGIPGSNTRSCTTRMSTT